MEAIEMPLAAYLALTRHGKDDIEERIEEEPERNSVS